MQYRVWRLLLLGLVWWVGGGVYAGGDIHHRTHGYHHHARHQRYARTCDNINAWDAFRLGWRDGLRSARGKFRIDRHRCDAYRKGWVGGYRSCHCDHGNRPGSYPAGYHQGCASTHDLKIRDDYYYERSRRYREGWIQGYRDCKGPYK